MLLNVVAVTEFPAMSWPAATVVAGLETAVLLLWLLLVGRGGDVDIDVYMDAVAVRLDVSVVLTVAVVVVHIAVMAGTVIDISSMNFSVADTIMNVIFDVMSRSATSTGPVVFHVDVRQRDGHCHRWRAWLSTRWFCRCCCC